jgi:hypothetical protein
VPVAGRETTIALRQVKLMGLEGARFFWIIKDRDLDVVLKGLRRRDRKVHGEVCGITTSEHGLGLRLQETHLKAVSRDLYWPLHLS